ncbi:MAG: zf-TFIIB domain-containing protein [Candidatus Omnitrophica bacterium]|nr:zf-TFIIB domain-containing protein [Candidatus Omnitrophota bacterium]
MKCPVCSAAMVEEDFGGVKVDVCRQGCKGIWFDWMELEKLDENNEGCGKALKEALNWQRVNDEGRPPVDCPKCGLPMHIHIYKSSKEINVDECYKCGGFFLDSGELKLIRDNTMTDEELEVYAESLMSDVPEFGKAQQDLVKMKRRNDAIRNYTRFLRASYYITGR